MQHSKINLELNEKKHEALLPTLETLTKQIRDIETHEEQVLRSIKTPYNKEIALRELIKTSKINYKINQLIKAIAGKNIGAETTKQMNDKRQSLEVLSLLNDNYIIDNNSKTASLVAKTLGKSTEQLMLELREERDKLIIYKKGETDMKDMPTLDKEAYKLGYDLKDGAAGYNDLSFYERSDYTFKTIYESYKRGIAQKLREHTPINRVAIFIQGAPNTGKTYTSEQVLRELNRTPYSIKNNNTGMFDKFDLNYNAIIIDDIEVKNLLNLADEYIVELYRRNSDNKIWKGDYFVITSNLDFETYIKKCGVKNEEQQEALATKFIRLKLIDGELQAEPEQTFRGTLEKQQRKVELANNFIDLFNKNIKNYQPHMQTNLNANALHCKKINTTPEKMVE